MVADWQVFLLIVVLFYAGLLLKPRLKKVKFCTVCAAVSATWLLLLLARILDWFDNEVLLALLLGESVVGGYYLVESKVRGALLVFRLPFLLTLSFAAYSIVAMATSLPVSGVVAAVWMLHGLLYVYRNDPSIRQKVDHIVACCSKW